MIWVLARMHPASGPGLFLQGQPSGGTGYSRTAAGRCPAVVIPVLYDRKFGRTKICPERA
ncbi:MAG TPA: hypothetical protein DHV88_03355 [Roseburia sp.]|nr:hypothetical protein [Roseburia sp.]